MKNFPFFPDSCINDCMCTPWLYWLHNVSYYIGNWIVKYFMNAIILSNRRPCWSLIIWKFCDFFCLFLKIIFKLRLLDLTASLGAKSINWYKWFVCSSFIANYTVTCPFVSSSQHFTKNSSDVSFVLYSLMHEKYN